MGEFELFCETCGVSDVDIIKAVQQLKASKAYGGTTASQLIVGFDVDEARDWMELKNPFVEKIVHKMKNTQTKIMNSLIL
eukprot:UN00737